MDPVAIHPSGTPSLSNAMAVAIGCRVKNLLPSAEELARLFETPIDQARAFAEKLIEGAGQAALSKPANTLIMLITGNQVLTIEGGDPNGSSAPMGVAPCLHASFFEKRRGGKYCIDGDRYDMVGHISHDGGALSDPRSFVDFLRKIEPVPHYD